MSYILDALKKSEAERNQNDSVSLLNYPNQKQIAGIPVWLIIFVTVVVNISALVVWTYWPIAETNSNPELVTQDTHRPTQTKIELPAATPKRKPKPARDYPDSVIPFAALNKSDRDAFPQVEFSTHVYSEDPEFRVLIANGLRLTEGEMLSDTVKLITISENGAVFLHANRLVEIPVLQDWRIQ